MYFNSQFSFQNVPIVHEFRKDVYGTVSIYAKCTPGKRYVSLTNDTFHGDKFSEFLIFEGWVTRLDLVGGWIRI